MRLKEAGKNFVERTAGNPVAWSIYKGCGRLSQFLGGFYGHARFVREGYERDQKLRRVVQEMFPQPVVASGPFKGLKYPNARSYGSALLPKLLGSYESELHGALESLLKNDYATVVDIGCAEGYYAIGIALRRRQAKIYAFDTSADARAICLEMAKLNGIGERISVGEFCDEKALRAISLGRRSLIICDCEGYEGALFTKDLAGFLAPHDLIIETHDFIDIELSAKMREVFSATHHIESIKSTDDIQKAHTYSFPELLPYDRRTRRLILSERRPGTMEWLVMTSRTA
jgi:hypothetical protein